MLSFYVDIQQRKNNFDEMKFFEIINSQVCETIQKTFQYLIKTFLTRFAFVIKWRNIRFFKNNDRSIS